MRKCSKCDYHLANHGDVKHKCVMFNREVKESDAEKCEKYRKVLAASD